MAEPSFGGDDRFKDPKRIGMGIYGEIYKCTDTESNSVVVLKHFRSNSEKNGFVVFLREIYALKQLDHPNIVRVLDELYEEDSVKFALECLDCDLDDYIHNVKSIDPHLIKSFLFQMLQGVSYLHSKNIIHRNLKPKNLLLDLQKKIIKIADFGHTGLPENPRTVTKYNYKPPEVLLNMPHNTGAVDIWAVGCIFALLVRGRDLFRGPFNLVIKSMVSVFGVPREEDWEGVTEAYAKVPVKITRMPPHIPLSRIFENHLEPDGLDLLQKLLCLEPHRRITASDALKHPYFNDLHENPQKFPVERKMAEELKLFRTWLNPDALRAVHALKIKGLDYITVLVEDTKNKNASLQEYNPVHKKLPILLHNGKPIFDTLLILEYIDDTWKQSPLLPQDPNDRAMARFWAKYGDDKVMPSMWSAFLSELGREQEKAIGRFAKHLKLLEEQLSGKRFFGGERIGYLDVALGWMAICTSILGEIIGMKLVDAEKFPLLTAWMRNFYDDPMIKESWPPRDKMIQKFKAKREAQLRKGASA